LVNLYKMKKALLILLGIFYLLPIEQVFSQVQRVQGRVLEGTDPLPGVSIKLKNSNIGTSTDVAGEFSIEASKDAVLVVSSLGYITQEVPVNNRTSITIQLKVKENALQDVVVIGYGEQKKITTTGAIASVSGEE